MKFIKPDFEHNYKVEVFTDGITISATESPWVDKEQLAVVYDGSWSSFENHVKDALLDAYARGLKHGLEINY